MIIHDPEEDITIKFRISVDENDSEQEELEEEIEKINKDIGILRLLTVFCLGWMIGG